MKKLIAMLLVAITAIEFVSATPTATDITAKQRYPWNGLVDIACKVSGIEADVGGYEFAVVAVDKETGKEYTVSNFSIQHNGEEVPDACANGDYSLLWNAREDIGQVVIERMTVRITLEGLASSVGKVPLWEGGPYWADRNIGAKKPSDPGLYFWWGDTTGHRPSGTTFNFNFDAFSFDNPTIYTLAKSVSELQSAGWVTSGGILAPAHDAAHVKWGGAWRMPTDQEFCDLRDKCDWTWTTRNGVSGYIVRGRGTCAANSIFLPAAGDGYKTSLYSSGGNYWSSALYSDGYYANGLYFVSNNYFPKSYFGRDSGMSIRPVQESTN